MFALVATGPDRPDGVNHVAGLEAIALRDLGRAGLASAEPLALAQELRSGCAMDGPVDSTTSEQCAVRRVDDRLDIDRGDIRHQNVEPRWTDSSGAKRGMWRAGRGHAQKQ
jgi:hypothetical protein